MPSSSETYPYHFPSKTDALLTLSYDGSSSLWTIEMHNGEDNRLTEKFLNKALKPALDVVERDWRKKWRQAQAAKPVNLENAKGALIIVGKQDQNKFFSNGLDFASVLKDPNFFHETFNPLLARLLSFPVPIVAAINGYAFAEGLLIALACDYRVMIDGTHRRAWACMNEIDFGANLPPAFIHVIQSKIRNPSIVRKIILEGHRFTPKEALDAGIIDNVAEGGSTEAVMAKAQEVAKRVSTYAKSGAYGLIKKGMNRETLNICSEDKRGIQPAQEDAAFWSKL